MNLKKIILASSIIELIIILVLTVYVYDKKDEVLGTKVSINPINKEDLIFSKEGNLKYFYEQRPIEIINSKPTWLPYDYSYTITINAEGLNDRFDYSIDKDPSSFRIVTIGDSYTFGSYVDTKDNYPEQLEDLLNKSLSCTNIKKFEVINLGVGGYDIEYAVTLFKKHGIKYSADLILWLLKDDDMDQIREFISAKSKEYRIQMEKSGKLKEYEKNGVFYANILKATRELEKAYGKDSILDYQYAVMKSFLTMYKNPLLVLSFPSGLNKENQKFIEKFIKESSIVYFYSQLPIPVNPDTALLDGHPNKAGYTLFANDIFRYLVDTRLIPCN